MGRLSVAITHPHAAPEHLNTNIEHYIPLYWCLRVEWLSEASAAGATSTATARQRRGEMRHVRVPVSAGNTRDVGSPKSFGAQHPRRLRRLFPGGVRRGCA